jgi:hypothetical protein
MTDTIHRSYQACRDNLDDEEELKRLPIQIFVPERNGQAEKVVNGASCRRGILIKNVWESEYIQGNLQWNT